MGESAWKFSDLKVPKPNFDVVKTLYEEAIEGIKNAESGDDVFEVLFENNVLVRRINEVHEIISIRHSMDTLDERYERDQKWSDEYCPIFEKLELDLKEAVYDSPYREYIEQKIGPMYFLKTDIKRKIVREEVIPLRQKEQELIDEYDEILFRNRKVVNGKENTFMELQELFSHEDRAIRKEAFKAFSEFLSENEEKLERVWDELIKVRTQIANTLGYDSYVQVGYLERERVDYGREEVAKFREQVVSEIVPLCSKLYEAQAKRLGLDAVMAYDEKIAFPDGNAKPLGDADYMMEQVVNVLREMSPETDEFISYILEHELIDYKPRPEKAFKEFYTLLPYRKAPFLFEHFTGSAEDVQSLSEGLGHAFASYRSSRRQPLDDYYFPPSDITEINAMAMIQFINKYAERLFGEDAWKYEFGNLQYFMTFIPFGTAVDEFQHICYDNPNLTPKERTYEWHKLEEKYMPWRKYDEDDEFMQRGGYWYHKFHFFYVPLYYIEYALATVNAMDMYRKYVERPGIAWKEYLELIDVGGSKGYLDILKQANLTPAYEEGAVKSATSYVKIFLEEHI